MAVLCLLTAAAPAQGLAPDPDRTVALRLERSAFDLPEGVPNVVVRPGTSDGAPARFVVLLHGYRGCAEVLVRSGSTRCGSRGRVHRGWGLGDAFAASSRDAILVVPQLALLARDGSPGRFAREGYFADFLAELRGAIARELGARAAPPADAPITLMAHSAGYEAALSVLAHGGVARRVDRVVLFDALYAGAPRFLAWALGDRARSLVSIHTGGGATAAQSRALARAARERLPAAELADHPASLREARGARVVVFETTAPHGRVPIRHLAEVL